MTRKPAAARRFCLSLVQRPDLAQKVEYPLHIRRNGADWRVSVFGVHVGDDGFRGSLAAEALDEKGGGLVTPYKSAECRIVRRERKSPLCFLESARKAESRFPPCASQYSGLRATGRAERGLFTAQVENFTAGATWDIAPAQKRFDERGKLCYDKNVSGSTGVPSLRTVKCKCAPRADSEAAVSPA